MSVEKPVVFFSHSTKDAEALRRLKDRFMDLTHGTIEVFLSSDGQSIRFGKNWAARIEEALKEAKLMFVFLTPNSLGSPWVYFESGHAYSKGIDVVPVGLFGVDVGGIPAPLSLLHGFNITNEDGLNNIITKVNDLTKATHRPAFTADDFRNLQGSGPLEAVRLLGDHVQAIEAIRFSSRGAAIDVAKYKATLGTITESKVIKGLVCVAPGVVLRVKQSSEVLSREAEPKSYLEAEVDPLLAHVAVPIAESVMSTVCEGRDDEDQLQYSASVVFKGAIEWERRAHVVMARLHGTKAVSSPDNNQRDVPWTRFRFEDMYFQVTSVTGLDNRKRHARVLLGCTGKSYTESKIGDLINCLFQYGVLSYPEEIS